MDLEIVRGTITNSAAIQSLIDALRLMNADGILYTGYPVMATADAVHTMEALLISPEYGVVAFNFPNSANSAEIIKNKQDEIRALITSHISKYEFLRKEEFPAITPIVVSYFQDELSVPEIFDSQYIIACPRRLSSVLPQTNEFDQAGYQTLCSAMRTINLKNELTMRDNINNSSSKGAILKTLDSNILILDQWQNKAIIETSDGPQRIRGLAGSGKTVILARKAAYLHSQHPEWNIVVTYHTRSLKPQFLDLINKFTIEFTNNSPNWERICVMNSWGAIDDPGVYTTLSHEIGTKPLNFSSAESNFGTREAFSGICNKLLSNPKMSALNPMYDVVLIDEAQDLPPSFFKLVYRATKDPKRIVWAYDELQNLNNVFISPVKDLFGTDDSGNALVTIHNDLEDAQQDIILHVCYRNTLWALTMAHALGFGIYRDGGLVQNFDDAGFWNDVGYTAENGELSYNTKISLKRSLDSTSSFFADKITKEDAVIIKQFSGNVHQYGWVAREIIRNLNENELKYEDILVVFADLTEITIHYNKLSNIFKEHYGINTHLAGETTSRNEFHRANSITCSGINRAKGNEAPMVYVVHAEKCFEGPQLVSARNRLFTAITRSKAWVRICGVGDGMFYLEKEITKVIENDYKLVIEKQNQEEIPNDLVSIKCDRPGSVM